MLTLAVEACGEGDWVSVSACMPSRTRTQCKLRWKSLQDEAMRAPGGRVWTGADDAVLLATVQELGDANWTAVAERLFSSKGAAPACMRRWRTLKRASAREARQKKKLTGELLAERSSRCLLHILNCFK